MVKFSNFVTIFMTVGLLLFWAAFYLLGLDITTEVASSLALGAHFTLTVTWLPAATRALLSAMRGGKLDGYQIFHIGFWLLNVALLAHRCWITAFRWADRPDWMLDLPVSAFIAWSIACASALIILSPETVQGEVPNRNKLYVIFAACLGSLVAGITIGVFIVRS